MRSSNDTSSLILIILIAITLLVLWAYGKRDQEQKMEQQAKEVARCKSVQGEYGGGKCYKNGRELIIKKEQ